jgi:enolase
VQKAVDNVNKIIKPALIGKDVTHQKEIDKLMVETLDGTKNEWGFCKAKLGANAILAVSLALARAGCAFKKIPLYEYIAHLAGKKITKYVMPVPSFNIINGGAHAGNKLSFQEFMIMPTGAKTFHEAMQIGVEVYQALQKLLKEMHGAGAINVGDEGGFGDPNLAGEEESLECVMKAIENAGHKGKVEIATDIAASDFFIDKEKLYNMGKKTGEAGKKITGDKLMEFVEKLCGKFPFVSIEDPFDQDDFETYAKMQAKLGKSHQIVGDDLLVTNPTRIKMAIEKKLCNALLLKVNQIGTLTESIDACLMAQKEGWGVMVSHRSGETEDSFIADLVVGLGTGEIKTGAPCRSDRLAKYNQLMRIEEELGPDKCWYAGSKFRFPGF